MSDDDIESLFLLEIHGEDGAVGVMRRFKCSACARPHWSWISSDVLILLGLLQMVRYVSMILDRGLLDW
jgi:hypothetical protein